MYGYETPPQFRTGQFLAAHELNVLRGNAIVLDQLSQRLESAFDSTGAYGDQVSYNLHPLGDFLLWRGGLRWRTGHEDLIIQGTAASFGSTNLLITIDGVLVDTVAAATNWSSTIDISTGYANGDILDIRITTSGNASKTSAFHVEDIYATPVTNLGVAWPGALPTFAGTYTAANLQKLSDASEYLWNTIAATPFLPHLAHVWRNGTHKPQSYTLWNGSMEYRATGDTIRVTGNVTFNTTESNLLAFVISPGGSYTATIVDGTGLNGTSQSFDEVLAFPGGTSVGDYARVHLIDECVIQAQPWPANNLYNLLILRTEPDVTVGTPAALSTANVSVTATNVNARLNAIVTMLNAIKARVDASTSFTRTRAMRYKYAVDDHQAAKFARTYPQTFVRRGARLIVKGKNVVLAFGPITFEQDEDGATDYAKFKYMFEQTLIGGETEETQRVYLDSIKGLFPGTTYYLIGDVVYGAEYL
jgi:hypothetical protein